MGWGFFMDEGKNEILLIKISFLFASVKASSKEFLLKQKGFLLGSTLVWFPKLKRKRLETKLVRGMEGLGMGF